MTAPIPRIGPRPLASKKDTRIIRALAAAVDAQRDTDTPQVPRWVKYGVDYTIFTDAAVSSTKTIWTMPPRTVVHQALLKLRTTFAASGAISAAITLVTPTGGDVFGTEFVPAIDSFIAPADDYSTNVAQAALLNWIVRADASVDLQVTCTLAGANCDTLTAGAADVWLLTSVYE